MINILSRAVSNIDDTKPPDATEKELKATRAKNEELMKKLNEAHRLLVKRDAEKTDLNSKLGLVVKAIIDASGDSSGDLHRNLKDKLDGLF